MTEENLHGYNWDPYALNILLPGCQVSIPTAFVAFIFSKDALYAIPCKLLARCYNTNK